MTFPSEADAKLFYTRYARAAGFGINMSRTKKTVREVCCNKIGKNAFYRGHRDSEERERNKTSKKTGCKAYIKLNRARDPSSNAITSVTIVKVVLEHNHPLQPEAC